MPAPGTFPVWADAPPGAQNEQQTITFTGIPASGAFSLAIGANNVPSTNWNDSAATLAANINAAYPQGTATVTGAPDSGSSLVDFGTFSENNIVPLMTIVSNTLEDSIGNPVVVSVVISQAGQLPAIVIPSSGKQHLGWTQFEKPAFNYDNWWKNLTYQWIVFLASQSYAVSAYVQTLFSATTQAAFLTAIGFSTYMQTLIAEASEAALLSAIGFSTYFQTIIGAANLAALQSALGITVGFGSNQAVFGSNSSQAPWSWNVPAGVSIVKIKAWGQGADAPTNGHAAGSGGGYVEALFSVVGVTSVTGAFGSTGATQITNNISSFSLTANNGESLASSNATQAGGNASCTGNSGDAFIVQGGSAVCADNLNLGGGAFGTASTLGCSDNDIGVNGNFPGGGATASSTGGNSGAGGCVIISW